MARIGSQGTASDLYVLFQQACYEPVAGHGWQPPAEIEQKMDASVHAYDAGWSFGQAMPWSPKCKDCRRIGRRNMLRRGLSHEQVERLFRTAGASWQWKSVLQPKEDTREYAYDDNGQYRLASAIKAGKRVKSERTIRQNDKIAASRNATSDATRKAAQELAIVQSTNFA